MKTDSCSDENGNLVRSVRGVRLAAVSSNIRYADRLDLVLVEFEEGSTISGVFTQNAFCAAPVVVAKQHLQTTNPRYFLINTGNANAGTGDQGIDDANWCCSRLAEETGVDSQRILPFSTGVIGEKLPIEKISKAIPQLFAGLGPDNWQAAATGIMTTDTRPKLTSKQIELGGKPVTITGMAKGSGMIRPDMATMLAYVCTDLECSKPELDSLLLESVSQSFNRITVDGDTSTNDACMLVATGCSAVSFSNLSPEEASDFKQSLDKVFCDLAIDLIRDAEGASKFVTVIVDSGATSEECLEVAYTIAESPLVKTALFASDPNWGRILAAVGRAGIADLDISQVAIFLGDHLIAVNGAVAPQYNEEIGQMEMEKDEITITIKLGRGDITESVWTSDLSHEYVRINAEYRT